MLRELTDEQRRLRTLDMARWRLLGALVEGGGVRLPRLNANFDFNERNAVLLLDQTTVPASAVSVLDKARVDPFRADKWGLFGATSVDAAWVVSLRRGKFRVVAFLRLTGKTLGGIGCEGHFAALEEILVEDTGESQYCFHYRVCRGEEMGVEKGKVVVYPVECLVPADNSDISNLTKARSL